MGGFLPIFGRGKIKISGKKIKKKKTEKKRGHKLILVGIEPHHDSQL